MSMSQTLFGKVKKFKIGFFKPLKDLSHFRLSVDYAES